MADETMDSSPDWVVKGLVVVKYPKDDMIGIFFGYYSLLVYEIQAVYITLFLRNRDMLTFYCCFTHLISEIMNYCLKHALKHPRPESGAPGGGLFEGRYGMPSQHCHCFAYLVTMSLFLTFHYYKRHIGTAKKVLVLTVATTGLMLQVIGRIYLRFHTLDQCIGGVAFGCLSAATFYVVGVGYFLPRCEAVCRLWPLRAFDFRKDCLSPAPRATMVSARTKVNDRRQRKD